MVSRAYVMTALHELGGSGTAREVAALLGLQVVDVSPTLSRMHRAGLLHCELNKGYGYIYNIRKTAELPREADE